MAFTELTHTRLNLGLNLRGRTAGLTMRPGQALDALEIYYREDGGLFKAPGWERVNFTALAGRPIAVRGFTYHGKNNDTGANPGRAGNFGIADPGAIFTRRVDLYSTSIVLTTSTFYFWNPATSAFATVALPGGITVDPSPKPTILIYNDNAYVVGWASQNLRYDPSDRALYRWGWESVPGAPPIALAAGGTLVAGAAYDYGTAWVDVYTGEQTPLGTIASITPSGGNLTVNVTGLTNYAGTRHFVGAGTNRDVGIVVYRSGADDHTLSFLDLLLPNTLTLSDTGLATDASRRAYRGTLVVDEPRFNFIEEREDRMFAVAWDRSIARVYYNDFSQLNSYVERWPALNFREVPLPDGEVLTALSKADQGILAASQGGVNYLRIQTSVDTGDLSIKVKRQPWSVGVVGPRAQLWVNGWWYFLSKRGPYRWQEGLSAPQWIGRDLAPLFIDPTSALCKLNQGSMTEAEVAHNPPLNTLHWVFPIDDALYPKTHLAYWLEADQFAEDPAAGWSFISTRAQTFDYSHALAPLGPDGKPVSPFDRGDRFIWADDLSYILEQEMGLRRGALPAGALTAGSALAGSTVTSLVATVALTPLFITGDALRGMRLEVEHASGLVEVREIASNTATAIVPDIPFDVAPATTARWWVGGIPAVWRSWADHLGKPFNRKRLLHLMVHYQKEFEALARTIDVTVLAGDAPNRPERVRTLTADLADSQEKLLVGLSGLFFAYEVANSRPDEPFVVTGLRLDHEVLGEERKE